MILHTTCEKVGHRQTSYKKAHCRPFAEYALVSEKSLVKIPEDLPFVEASLFGCAVMCGAGTALYSAGIRPGQTVAVFGLGGVGLAAVLGAVTAGAGRIVAVDPSEEKLALARSIGATDCVNAGSAVAAEAVRELTRGGVDHAIDASSSLDGFGHAFEATRRGGCTVTTSLTHPSQKFSFPLARIVAEARTIKGSYIGTCVPGRDIPAFIQLYRQGRMPVDKLVTRTLKLDQINEAFDALSEAKGVRQVITFSSRLPRLEIGNVAEGDAHGRSMQGGVRAAEIKGVLAVAQVERVDDGVELVVGMCPRRRGSGAVPLLV
jgi:alcohol dehydrogenase